MLGYFNKKTPRVSAIEQMRAEALFISNIVVVLWLDLIEIKQGYKDKRGESCGKSAVIENKASVDA